MIADHTDSVQVANRLKLASKRIHDLVDEAAHARQVKEFISDMRKNLLAKWMMPHLKAGESAAAAEAAARSTPEYVTSFENLQEQYETAERAIARWQAEQTAFDAARSLLSFEKETMRELS